MLRSGSFGDILIAAWGGTLLYTEGIFWGSKPQFDDLCSILFRVTQYAIHQSCQPIQYTRGSWSYDYHFFITCTPYLHTLLIECHTQVYSYIADKTANIWVGGGALTFSLRWVYMSILTLWFFDWEFCTHFDYTFWVCMHKSPTEYGIMYIYTPYYICIDEWSFMYAFNELQSFKFFVLFLKVTSSDLAK